MGKLKQYGEDIMATANRLCPKERTHQNINYTDKKLTSACSNLM
jgi:hypothetical protein